MTGCFCFSTTTTQGTHAVFEVMTKFVSIKLTELQPKPCNQFNTYWDMYRKKTTFGSKKRKFFTINLNWLIDSASRMVLPNNLFHSLTQKRKKECLTYSFQLCRKVLVKCFYLHIWSGNQKQTATVFTDCFTDCYTDCFYRLFLQIVFYRLLHNIMKNVTAFTNVTAHLQILNLTPCKGTPQMFLQWLQLLIYMFILNTFDSTFKRFIKRFIEAYIAIVQVRSNK